VPYLHRLNRTRLLQGKCRTLLNTTVREKSMKTAIYVLTALSILSCFGAVFPNGAPGFRELLIALGFGIPAIVLSNLCGNNGTR
jgi:hypothetical protein